MTKGIPNSAASNKKRSDSMKKKYEEDLDWVEKRNRTFRSQDFRDRKSNELLEYWQNSDNRNKRSEALLQYWASEEAESRRAKPKIKNNKILDALGEKVKRTFSEDHIKKLRAAALGRPKSQETIDRLRKSVLAHWADDEWKRKTLEDRNNNPKEIERRNNLPKLWEDPIRREKQSERIRKLWENPEYRERQLEALFIGKHQSPNKFEIKIWDILDMLYPEEYNFTGNASEGFIEGKPPDFINIYDTKIVEGLGEWGNGTTGMIRLKLSKKEQSYLLNMVMILYL